MSCSRNQRVLRVSCEKYGIDDPYAYLEDRIGEITWDVKSFCPSLAGEKYIDYILVDEPVQYSWYGPFDNTWQPLSEREKEQYRPLFEKIIPDVDMDDVVEVESCWYDGVEAPDIYRPDDSHYETLSLDCSNCNNTFDIHNAKPCCEGEAICPRCGCKTAYKRRWGVCSYRLIKNEQE